MDSSAQDNNYSDVKTLLSWKAPRRPFRKRSKDFFLSSLLIVFLIQIILFLVSQYLLMLVVVSITFLAYVLVSVPPHDFRYRISTEGIIIEDHFFLWQELYDFYIKKRDDVQVVHIRTRSFLPGELSLMLGQEVSLDHVKKILLQFLPFREYVKPTFMEKSANWLSKNFPLERSAHHHA